MKKQLTTLLASLAIIPSASAVVIYSDTFSRVEGSGDTNGKPADPNNFSAWGTNDNTLGGTQAQGWLVGPSRGGGANQVTDGALASTIEGSAFYDFDASTVAPAGFRLTLDFNRFHPFNAGSGNGFMVVGFGADTGSVLGGAGFSASNADVAVLFQQGAGSNIGNTQFYEDGALLAGTGSTGPVDYGDPTAGHSIALTFIPAVAGAYGDADTINGSLSVDGGAAYNFSVSGGANFGALSLSSNGFVHRSWDNIVAESVPEPSSLALSLVASLGLLRRRR